MASLLPFILCKPPKSYLYTVQTRINQPLIDGVAVLDTKRNYLIINVITISHEINFGRTQRIHLDMVVRRVNADEAKHHVPL